MKTIAIAGAALAFVCCPARAADWFVDSENGNDAADGLSAEAAVRTLDRVNELDVKPGDRVLFRRGGLWRGSLIPKSGEPGRRVIYAFWGSGPKPILQQSVDRSRPEDWVDEGNGIWATQKRPAPEVKERIWDGAASGGWSGSFQEGYKGTVGVVEEGGERFVRVALGAKTRPAPNLLQVWGPRLADLPKAAVLRLKVRSSMPFRLERVTFQTPKPPWTVALAGQVPRTEIGREWSEVDVLLTGAGSSEATAMHLSLGDVMPEGATFDFVPVGLWRAEVKEAELIPADVGIFICNHGEKWGTKKWFNPDWDRVDGNMAHPGGLAKAKEMDFWYDPAEQRVFVKYPSNPGKAFRSIELALTRHVVREGGCHDILYDGLWIRYGGAHGFGGGTTRGITIRNCDISWIGGGLQFWKKDKVTGKVMNPVRFGNGIEFWCECHDNLVERNRLWQIYDAALTNQAKDNPKHETDVVWRDNVIWQAEYSFEYWNHDPSSQTRNVVFEHNTCIDAGYCWSHDQRPDRNGAHLMFYDNSAPTTNFVVRNNLFVRTTDRSTRFFNDWRARDAEAHDGLEMYRNLYWIPENLVAEYHVNWRERQQGLPIRAEPGKWGAGVDEFSRYKAEFGLDADSIWGVPLFVDESRRDYRLKPGSPGKGAATDGTDIGARGMPGLDEDQSSKEWRRRRD